MVSGPHGLHMRTASLINQLMQQMDANQDGSIDQTEFAQAVSSSTQETGSGSTDLSKLFTTLDTDGDGKLSKSELTNGFQQLSPNMKMVLLGLQDVAGDSSTSPSAVQQSGDSTDTGSSDATSSDALGATTDYLLNVLQELQTGASNAPSSSTTSQGVNQSSATPVSAQAQVRDLGERTLAQSNRLDQSVLNFMQVLQSQQSSAEQAGSQAL